MMEKRQHPAIAAYLKAMANGDKEKADRILREFPQVRAWLRREMGNPNSRFFVE